MQCKIIYSERKCNRRKAVLGLREDNTLKADFQDSDLASFWGKIVLEYPILSDRVLKLLTPFASTYHREVRISTVVSIKMKAKNNLDRCHDVQCALAVTELHISKVVKHKQYQSS
jgi:hypothetical protein